MAARPTIRTIGETVVDAVDAGGGPVVVVAPGSSSAEVTPRITDGLAGAGHDTRTLVVRRTGRVETPPADDDAWWVVVEAQWLRADALAPIVDHERTVWIHRPHRPSPPLALIHADAYGAGALFELGALDAVGIADEHGLDPDEAAAAFAATGGRADLVRSWLDDGTLDRDVAVRLSVLDDDTRLVAELLACGTPADCLVAVLPHLDDGVLDSAMATLASEGLTDGDEMPTGLADSVRRCTPAARRGAAIERLAAADVPGLAPPVAEVARREGWAHAALGDLHLRAARELAPTDTTSAAEYRRLAVELGTTGADVALLGADLAMRRGAVDVALRELSTLDATDPEVALLTARAWYLLGDLAAAAHSLAAAGVTGLSAWATLGAGTAPPDGEESGHGDPVVDALDRALRAWAGGDRDAVVEALGHAVVRTAGVDCDSWPVTPHQVATMVAGRLGDLELAGRWADLAVVDRPGGDGHRGADLLWSACCNVRRGRLDDAVATIDEVGDRPLTPRERWWRAAVRSAIAVRDPEPGDLEAAVADASAALDRLTVDLYDLDLLGEVAAARARVQRGAIDVLLEPAVRLVDRLGAPAHLDLDLAIVRFLAALSTDDAEAWSTSADAVAQRRHDATAGFATAVVDAAAVVRSALDGEVDGDAAVAAAEALAEAGRLHEAARLCGLAAMHATDESTTRMLLRRSRDWRTQRARAREVRGVDRTVVQLSEQEERVARLVDDGLTYKAIGAELFISPKTVEHHVAHIRAKFGAGPRAELLAAIRAYFADEPADG